MREMKDSGVEWIGKIPKEWETGKTLYALAMPITDGPHETPELFDEGIPFVSAEAVSCGNGHIDFEHIRGYISQEFYDECCKKYVPQVNDVYMIKSGATTGKVAKVETDEIFTIWSPLAVFRVDDTKYYYEYLYYFIQSDGYQKQIENKWTYGTQQNIGMRTLEKLFVCFPPLFEQKKISDYLDSKCAKIDSIIEKQQAIIEKLKEYKLSVITETITNGLNSDAEKKDSGVEYIGRIPINCKVSKLKYVVEFHNGDRGSNYPSGEDLVDEGIAFLSSNNIHGMIVDINTVETKYITKERYDILGGAKLKINDIVFCLRGSIGICAINKELTEGTIASSLVVIRPKNINHDFLNYLLHSNIVYGQSEIFMNGTCAANLSAQNLGNYYFVEHSLNAQKEIVEYLDEVCKVLDLRILNAECICKKLQEYKKSLIYEVVTGKKEV